MGQKKLLRFEELRSFSNVLEYPAGIKGNWNNFFQNNNPVLLELACGKGEYAVGLGRMFPNKNFIGIDIKGNRIWKGAKTALDARLTNVAFLRIQIDKLTEYFAANEVNDIWITFPDPQLRFSKMKKRLIHPKFLRLYQTILQPGGKVNLKTDSPDLYNFTKTIINLYGLQLIEDFNDVYKSNSIDDKLKIKTHYETLDISQSNKVHFLSFIIDKALDKNKDEQLKEFFRAQTI